MSFGATAILAAGRSEMPETQLGKIRWLVSRVTDLDAEISGLKRFNEELKREHETEKEWSDSEHLRIEGEWRSGLTSLAAGGLRLQTLGVVLLVAGSILIMCGSLIS